MFNHWCEWGFSLKGSLYVLNVHALMMQEIVHGK